MNQASSTIKKCSFELGGLAPFIVFADADIDAAVEGACVAKFRNTVCLLSPHQKSFSNQIILKLKNVFRDEQGQTCVCTQFLLVHQSIYAAFAEKLAAKVSTFKIGNGFSKDTTHGPLIHGAGIEKVERHLKDAVEKGAKILCGGKRGNVEGFEEGYFFEPTGLWTPFVFLKRAREEEADCFTTWIVVTGLSPECLISQEETFGLSPFSSFSLPGHSSWLRKRI